VNREFERIWKEAVVNRFTVVVRFTWVTEETNQQTTLFEVACPDLNVGPSDLKQECLTIYI
jgi:hypothetical protein